MRNCLTSHGEERKGEEEVFSGGFLFHDLGLETGQQISVVDDPETTASTTAETARGDGEANRA